MMFNKIIDIPSYHSSIKGIVLFKFLPLKFHGQRSLVGPSPGGLKESDTTQQLNSCCSNFIVFQGFQFKLVT